MISANLTIPDTSNAAANTILTHPNVASWAMRQYHPAPPPPASTQVLVDHPPQSSSPMLSQQSSPSSSRAASPNRTSSCDSNMLQTQTQPPPLTSQTTTSSRNMPQRIVASSLKNVRRPSAETTPPPAMAQQQLLTNELILPQNMKHISEVTFTQIYDKILEFIPRVSGAFKGTLFSCSLCAEAFHVVFFSIPDKNFFCKSFSKCEINAIVLLRVESNSLYYSFTCKYY